MNSDQENFEALRRLIALKQYEQPPPRYFSELPGRIWMRIEREPASQSFWERLLPNIGLSPAFAYSFGLLACGSLFMGIVFSLNTEPEQLVGQPVAEDWHENSARLATTDGIGMRLQPYQPNHLASTNPVMNSDPLPSLFDGFKLRALPANFIPGQ